MTARACWVVLALAGCSSPPPGKLAVLRIENLTGDPAWDWASRAGAHALAVQLGAIDAGGAAPGDARAALIASGQATRFVQASLSKVGYRLRVDATLEDGGTPTVLWSYGDGGVLLPLIDGVAKGLDPSAKPYGTRNDAALKALFDGSAEAALKLDPNFDEARGSDARGAGERAYMARDFTKAASLWGDAVKIAPDDVAVWNNLGYARAYAGDLDGAVAAAKEYARLKPNEANPLDSLGEIYFIGGKYAESEQAFLEAHSRDASFLGGAALAKAAQARLAAGDRGGAQTRFARYLDSARSRKDPGVAEAEARWRFCLEGVPAELPEAKATGLAMLIARGKRAEARKAAPPQGPPMLAAIVFMTLDSASPAEWTARAERSFPGEPVAPLRDVALGYALWFDGKRVAAEPVLRRVMARTRATPSDPAAALVEKRRYLDPYVGSNPFGVLACTLPDRVLGNQ